MKYQLVIKYNNYADNGLGPKTKVIRSDDCEKVIKTFSLWLGQLTRTATPHPEHSVHSVEWKKDEQ